MKKAGITNDTQLKTIRLKGSWINGLSAEAILASGTLDAAGDKADQM